MLTCCNLTYADNGVLRFQGLGISLLPGSLLSAHGTKGKTVFLKLMAGASKPLTGTVTFEGKPVRRTLIGRNREYASLCLYLPQTLKLNPDWSVEKTVLHLAGIRAEPLLLIAALRYFELETVRARALSTLSQTLYARVKLVPLLLAPRPIWLLDEPDTGLDDEGREMLYRLISDRCNQDGIVVMATNARGVIKPCLELELEDFI